MKKIIVVTDDKTAMVIMQAIMDKRIVEMHVESVGEPCDKVQTETAIPRTAHRLPGGKTIINLIAEEYHYGNHFLYHQCETFLVKYGFNPKSTSSIISALVKGKYLKKTGRGKYAVYEVTKEIPADLRITDIRDYR